MKPKILKTFGEASAFVKNAGFCLRYGSNGKLPIPSLYQAVFGDTKKPSDEMLKLAITLTNQLLEKHEVIEVSAVAGRLTLVHRTLVPALYSLLQARSWPALSPSAKKALAFIEAEGQASAGDVRKHLRLAASKTEVDPVYEILAELQDRLLVDRGPFKISATGIPYLSREGYPYHLFEEAHPELAKEGRAMDVRTARERWLLAYLKSAQQCSLRKIGTLFKNLLSPDEIQSVVTALAEGGQVKMETSGKNITASLT